MSKKKSRAKTELEHTAYHEAGHAVMAWYCGCDVDEVTIEADHDKGIAGRVRHGDANGEWGNLGIRIWGDAEHGMLVEELDGSTRPPTPAELEHQLLTNAFVAMGWDERVLLVCAAGEAAGFAFVPEYKGPPGSEQDQADALDINPHIDWDEWVGRAREFLLRPAVRRRVKTLAAALLDRITIDGTEAKQIIRSAM